MGTTTDLRRFIRAAELYGVSGIFEEAARKLGPHDQGRLALHLRRVDADWKLTRAQAMELAVGLVGQDTPDKKVRELAGISQPTVRKARSRAVESESFGKVRPIGPREESDRENAA
jgi:hypothetical protein